MKKVVFDVWVLSVGLVLICLPNHAKQCAPKGAVPFAVKELLIVDKYNHGGDNIRKRIGVEIQDRHKLTCY